MKKILILILALSLMPMLAFGKAEPDIITFGSTANPQTAATGGAGSDGVSDIFGNNGPYSELTCFFVGTAGSLNVDIDGSLDRTTFFGMQDDITATGGQSIVSQPFNHYRIDIDTCGGGCSITITCQPVQGYRR